MIIPVRCFTCSNVLADKYESYKAQVRKDKLSKRVGSNTEDIDKVVYLTKEFHEKTSDGEVMDKLKLLKMCCRRHFMTHVDIE